MLRSFEGPDDDAAVEQAVQLLNEQVIEVWDHSRLVSRLEPDKGLDPTFVSPAAIWMNGVLSSGNVCDPQNK